MSDSDSDPGVEHDAGGEAGSNGQVSEEGAAPDGAPAPSDGAQTTGAPDDAVAEPRKRSLRRGGDPKARGIDLSKVSGAIRQAPTGGAPVPVVNGEFPADGSAPADGPVPVEESDGEAALGEIAADDDAAEGEPADDESEDDATPADDALDGPAGIGLRAAVEAIIFASDEPVTAKAIAKAIGDVKPSMVKKVIELIKAQHERDASGIALEEVAGGWTMLTREEYAPAIRRLRKATESRKLTGAALETLAVVAYKQPIQKQEIEDIRGVSCGPVLRTLMEQGLLKIAGRADVLGRPLLYGTTKRFLDVFGIPGLKDLPKISELNQG